eukprot:2186236-Rhodomonas_salina.4
MLLPGSKILLPPLPYALSEPGTVLREVRYWYSRAKLAAAAASITADLSPLGTYPISRLSLLRSCAVCYVMFGTDIQYSIRYAAAGTDIGIPTTRISRSHHS